ncbi:MAG TPA: serine hydrolase domain-containing protein [Polyangiaceae bacterium]|nr:serine hydrolase domain-containing protein [Polyangiaceae bacterium]
MPLPSSPPPPAVDRRAFFAATAALAGCAGARREPGAAAAPARPPPRAGWVPSEAVLAGIPRLLTLTGVPGVALAVVERDAVIWSHGAGVRRLGRAEPIAPETVFEGASLGKPVFAWGVLGLVDAGALDLDRPLSEYLPLPEVSEPRAKAVTARHVLSHTSGLPNWRRAIGPLVPKFAPGERFSYSGEGVFYLQRVVERLVGRPFGAWARDAVLRPLGMGDSSYVWRPAYEGRLAAGHLGDGEVSETVAPAGRKLQAQADASGKPLEDWTYDDAVRGAAASFPKPGPAPEYVLPVSAPPAMLLPNAAASLYTTVADYARFMAHVLGAPVGGPGAAGALRESTRRAMLTPQVRVSPGLSWGLGWGLEHDHVAARGDRAPGYAWHWGNNRSVQNFVLADLAARRAIVIFTNGENGFKLYERLATSAAGREAACLLSPLVG